MLTLDPAASPIRDRPEAVAALCCHPPCQERLAQAGAAWFAFSMLTSYDFTLDEAVKEGVEASAETNAQLVANERARKAAFTLRRLGGYPSADGKARRRAESRLLCSHPVPLELLGADETDEAIPKLLCLLNSASETPYLIWNGLFTCRAPRVCDDTAPSLLQRAGLSTSRGCGRTRIRRPQARAQSRLDLCACLRGASYIPLHDAPQFCTALLDYLGEEGGRGCRRWRSCCARRRTGRGGCA